MKKLLQFLGLFLSWGSLLVAQTSGSVTQGLGTTTISDMMPACPSNHKTPLGKISSSDGKNWIVPADNNFATAPKLFDLHNTCNNVAPANLTAANLNALPTTVIDAAGELITGYIFADNYFELYINGVLVGVDPVPFTPFNSCAVRFKVARPYTIAVKLVDWEENVGLGSEIQSASSLYHPGDGGFIAQFSDGTITDASWKAQSFYIAPIQDLNTVVEKPDGTHSTASASTNPGCNANCYGIHYEVPANWMDRSFNDGGWPAATLYTATQVTNSPAYTNFASTAWSTAKFIWTSSLILDNLVLVRKTVGATSSVGTIVPVPEIQIVNPFHDLIQFSVSQNLKNPSITLHDFTGRVIQQWRYDEVNPNEPLLFETSSSLSAGIYLLNIRNENTDISLKINKLN